jgi:exosortase B
MQIDRQVGSVDRMSILDGTLLLVGALMMFLPTYAALDKAIWGIVGQGHGPVMLALSVWLAYQRWPTFRDTKANPATFAGITALVIGLVAYVVGRSQDVLVLDAFSQIPVFIGLALLLRGWVGLKVMWFPIFFLVFLLPVPGSVVDMITAPLKSWVSTTAEWVLYTAQYPIGRSGVTLTIGPYRLLVADACSGLNSIFALEAIGIFYLSVASHKSVARNIILACAILPISFVSNVMRVIVLVLVTYYFGDAAGQGFVHDFAGILLFMMATVLIIMVDGVLAVMIPGSKVVPLKSEGRHD